VGTPVEVVAHGGQHQLAELHLAGGIVGLEEQGIVDGRAALHHPVEQRDQPGFQGRKERGQRGHGGARLIGVQQRIVGRVPVAQVPGLFQFERDDGAEARQEPRKGILSPRLGPDLLGERTFPSQPLDEIGGKFFCAAEIPPDLAQQGTGGFVPGIARLVSGLTGRRVDPTHEQGFDLRRDQFVVSQALQRGQLVGPGLPATGWHVGFLIPGQERGGAVEVLHLAEPRNERFQCRKRLQRSISLSNMPRRL
jgi:hypothetical protein